MTGISFSSSSDAVGLCDGPNTNASGKDQIVRIESIEFFLEHRQDDANEDMVTRPGEELCDKFPTLHSSKNTTEPKELTGQTISPIAFDSSYQGQKRGFGETLENKTAVEDMLQQELETLGNELNVVRRGQ